MGGMLWCTSQLCFDTITVSAQCVEGRINRKASCMEFLYHTSSKTQKGGLFRAIISLVYLEILDAASWWPPHVNSSTFPLMSSRVGWCCTAYSRTCCLDLGTGYSVGTFWVVLSSAGVIKPSGPTLPTYACSKSVPHTMMCSYVVSLADIGKVPYNQGGS